MTPVTGCSLRGDAPPGARYPLETHILEEISDEGGDRGALGAREGHVREQRVPLELLDHRDHAVVPADPQVVSLRDVVREHDARSGPDPGQHGQQHAALERLGLVHDDERVVQRPAPDVGQRQHLEHVAGDQLVDPLLGGDRAERVVDRLPPRAHLLRLGARQVAEVLAADRVERAEDDDLAVLTALHNRLEARAERERRLAGARPAAHADDPDLGIEQEVEGDALLGRAAVQAERVPVAPHQLDLLVRPDPGEGAGAAGVQHQAGVTGQGTGGFAVESAVFVQFLDVGLGNTQLGHAGPARVNRQLGPVLLRVQPDRRRLDSQRQVLADKDHVVALVGEGASYREDARVVVPEPEPGREDLRVEVVELYAGGAAEVADLNLGVQAAVLEPEVIEVPEGLAGEVAQLRGGTFRFELGDDHDRQNHVMLIESRECIRVSEQDARVEDVGTTLHRVGHAILPWAPVTCTDAADRTRRSPAIRGQTCRTDRGCPLRRAAPALSRRTMATGAPPRGAAWGTPPPLLKVPAFHLREKSRGSAYFREVKRRNDGYVRSTSAGRAESPLCGRPASTRRRNRTQSVLIATAGSRPSAALRWS